MRYDHFSMLPEKAFQPRNGRHGMTLEGGGGGGGQPTQTSQISIPEYLQPYAESMAGQAGALTGIGPDAGEGVSYQTYGGERLAGVTGEQQAARAEMAGYAGPQQFAPATQFAAQGGNYLQMAMDPRMTQAFMSPYMQAVTDVEKKAATREAQMAQQQANLAAGRRPGAMGSAASIIGQAERERGLMDRMAQIQATGSQKAFEAAQQAQQFGSQQALQAAQTLGQLGVQEQATTLGRLRAQEEFGRLEQERQQQALDIAYQDFLNQQRYPYQQIEFMSGLLRGLPGSSQTMYQAEPSTLSQVAGGGLGLIGLSKLLGS